MDKNPVLTADVERASVADGELLESVDSLVYTYDEDLSYRPHPDVVSARYMEISVFKVKAGHGKGFEELVKMAIDANKKAGASAHWATFEAAIGEEGMRKFREGIASIVEASHSELFAFNPHMSYVAPEWIKADPPILSSGSRRRPGLLPPSRPRRRRSPSRSLSYTSTAVVLSSGSGIAGASRRLGCRRPAEG